MHDDNSLFGSTVPTALRMSRFPIDLSPCLKAGDSWAAHGGPGMLARRQNAVTG